MVQDKDFDTSVPLPAGLTISAIKRAIAHIEKKAVELIDLYAEQRNVFSAIVGILGTIALDIHSDFEKHKHSFTAQQSFPDLCRRKAHKPLRPDECLESKGSKRPYSIQSHFDHPGWYIVGRYLVDPTETVESGKPLIIWRVDVVFLEKTDWKYEGSKASDAGGGRTHTFGVRNPAKKLDGTAVYKRSDIVLRNQKPVPANGN